MRPGGWTPLLRLIGLIAFAILLVVLVVVWAQGCAGDRKRDAYADYMGDLRLIAQNSASIGQKLAEPLTTPGLKQDELESQLTGLIEQQSNDVSRADDLDPPGPVTPESGYAIDALSLRVNGMQGLLNVFKSTKDSKDATAAWPAARRPGAPPDRQRRRLGGLLPQADDGRARGRGHRRRLRPRLELRRERAALHGQLDGRDLAARARSLDRRNAGQAHGSSLAYVRAQPSGQTLRPTRRRRSRSPRISVSRWVSPTPATSRRCP